MGMKQMGSARASQRWLGSQAIELTSRQADAVGLRYKPKRFGVPWKVHSPPLDSDLELRLVVAVEQLARRSTRRRLDSELDRLREYHCMFTTVTTNSARQCQGLRMWRSVWRNSRRRPSMAPSIWTSPDRWSSPDRTDVPAADGLQEFANQVFDDTQTNIAVHSHRTGGRTPLKGVFRPYFPAPCSQGRPALFRPPAQPVITGVSHVSGWTR